MKQSHTALAAAIFAVALPAQDEAPQRSLVEFEKLVAEWKAANETYRAANAAMRASDEFETAQKAKDAAALRKLLSAVERPDAAAFGQRALELADRYAGADALAVLVFTANNLYDKTVFEGMIERVEKNHIDSAGLDGILENGMALQHFIGGEKTATLLTRIAKENPHPQPRAWAMYWQAIVLQRDKSAGDAGRQRAAELMAKARELAAGTVLGDRIDGPRFEQERLQIGMTAPDIEGVDTEGVAFKLSDYRGKVVVLDFWGFW